MAASGVVRHKRFDECIADLSAAIPRLAEAIEGALYSISRQPEKDGVFIARLGVWQARLHISGAGSRVLLYDSFNSPYVHMLCARLTPADIN